MATSGPGTPSSSVTAGDISFNPLSLMKDLGDILSGVNSDVSNIDKGKLTQAQATADISTYQQYLNDFPQYESFKETEYKTTENQTLADRLSAMGMRGIQTGGAGQATSGAAVYSGEKSLYDQGYTQLVNSLELEKTKAQGQLAVAQASLQEGKSTENAGIGGLIGGILGGIGGFILGGPAGAVAGYELGAGAGEAIGGAIH
jgi:hypothetical protein